MKSRNKRKIVIIIVALLFIFHVGHKILLGYGPVGYFYNFYYYLTHKSFYELDVINKKKFPILLWRITNKGSDESIIFESFHVNGSMLSASLSSAHEYEKLKRACDGDISQWKAYLNQKKISGYVCINNLETRLKPFLCILLSGNKCLFAYNYDPKYRWLYIKLLEGFKIE